MKRLSPLMMLGIGLGVGLLVGASFTVASSEEFHFNYDQVVGQAGQTKVTRAKLAEYCIARAGNDVAPVLQEQAVLEEALRVAGVTVTDAEVQGRYDEMRRYAADNVLALNQFEAYPQGVLKEKLRSILMCEKALKITVSPTEAQNYFINNPGHFFSKPMAHMICIVTDKQENARSVMARLKDGEDASKLSVMYSTNDIIRNKKGDVGWQTRDRVNNPNLAEAIFDANGGKGLKAGQFTDPIAIVSNIRDNNTGVEKEVTEYWIAYIADYRQGKVPQFEDIKDVAIFLARGEKLSKLMPRWFAEQRQKIEVRWVTNIDNPTSAMGTVSPPPPPRQ